MLTRRRIAAGACWWVLAAGCGGSPRAADGAPAPSTDAPKPTPPASAAEAPAPAEAPKPAPAEPPSSGEKPSRPPVDTITGAKVSYVINYSSSAPNEAAEKKCEAAAAGDAAVKAACMKKERSDFYADVVRFVKDAQDKHWFSTYRRTGSKLVLLHKTPVTLENDGDTGVKLQILGDDKAVRVLFPTSKSFSFRVPNDYSLEITEPRLGKLLYDAKLDVVGN